MKSPFSLSPSGVPQNPARNRRQFHRGLWPGYPKVGFLEPRSRSPLKYTLLVPKSRKRRGFSYPLLVRFQRRRWSPATGFRDRYW
ncbi:hypothetical protein ES332_D04G193200v1 [Gossypium tomentosum]|uniref:Uncharacterized protein n=1 Tax=Gossypium tomentosum TaxID=34277 RepID=A0A5D2LGH6_GOSTO|nr:hypothetical protein ES332_D04G193200v1 [Gossypium tomentosum]